MSVTIVTLTFMASVQAQVIPVEPGTPGTYEECIQRGSSVMACQTLFSAYDNCMRNHSEDDQALKSCRDNADAAYFASNGQAPSEGQAFIGETLPVKTEADEANYNKMDPDHKGYRNAEE